MTYNSGFWWGGRFFYADRATCLGGSGCTFAYVKIFHIVLCAFGRAREKNTDCGKLFMLGKGAFREQLQDNLWVALLMSINMTESRCMGVPFDPQMDRLFHIFHFLGSRRKLSTPVCVLARWLVYGWLFLVADFCGDVLLHPTDTFSAAFSHSIQKCTVHK